MTVLPPLVGEPLVAAPPVFHETVAVPIAIGLDPVERRTDMRPECFQHHPIAGAFEIRPGEHHEQRCRIHAAVIAPERNFAGFRHFAITHFMKDLAWLGIGIRIEFRRLVGRKMQ